jgi:uncharacterized protein RhaS with RHS repeats
MRTTYTYDGGASLKPIQPISLRTTVAYDDGGTRPRIVEPTGQRVNMIYDPDGRKISAEGPVDRPADHHQGQ